MNDIAVVVDLRLSGYQRAGIATYGARLAEAIAEHDLADIQVITTAHRPTDPELEGFRQIRSWTPPHHRMEQFGLACELANLRVDVVHFPDFIPARVLGPPSVITVHDLAFARFPRFLTATSARYYGQLSWAVHAAERIIAVSRTTADDLIDLYGASPGKIDVVYEAPDPILRDVAPHSVGPNPWGLGGGYLLFVGTREPRKNLTGLLDGYARARNHRRMPPLVIAGRRGWLVDDLEERARTLGIADAVHWIGGVARHQMPGLFGGALALILASHYEGFGLPVVDAMAMGVPCIVSRRGALPEIAGNAALYVDPDDTQSIATALRRIVDEPRLRDDLSRLGHQRAAMYTWQRVAEETIEVYRRASA
ncbi:MAG: glycosyltransferase family 1 protein [Chloroflexota bacterium]|nr:MAG: glycosyltransferase family 1 protein [Chloroflexota bacterium]